MKQYLSILYYSSFVVVETVDLVWYTMAQCM